MYYGYLGDMILFHIALCENKYVSKSQLFHFMALLFSAWTSKLSSA